MSDTPKSSTSDGQLDITQVPNEDLDQLANKIESFYKNDATVKSRLAYSWDRNQKFLDGDQWLVFDGSPETGGVWNRLQVSKANEYIPRPVSNYIWDGYQTLKSYLLKNKPRSSVRPNTQTFKDKSAAKVADLCLEANWERLQESQNFETAAACLLTYGTVFKKDFWDTSSQNMVKIPRMESIPTVDPMTGDIIGTREVPSLDPLTGDPLFDEIPQGDVNTAIVEPHRIALDPMGTDLHTIGWIMEYSIQSLSWIKETYGKEGDGYTGRVDEVKDEAQLHGALKNLQQNRFSSGVKSTAGFEAVSGSTSAPPLTNSAVVKEYYERPSKEHPRGRLVVVASGITLYAGESPYTGPEKGDWHPFSECRWEIVPGRFWGKSPIDPACEIQKRINSIDSLLILTRKTMAVPQKLIPIGSGIAPGSWSGRPGQQVEYRETGGKAPSIIPGVGVDASVLQERAQAVEDLKTVMGAIDILKGDRPPGVNAASALSLLYEVGTGKLFPVLDRWKRFVENSQKKQLKIIANKYKEPREDYINLLKSKNSSLSESTLSRFIGSDLYDNCNVVVEAGSNIPKLLAAQQSRLMEAAQVGVLGLESPTNRMEFNRQMGIVGFDNDIEPDVKRQEWENDVLDDIEKDPSQMPIVLAVDDDAVHMEILARRMKEPSFMDLSSEVQQAYMKHYQDHMDAKAKKEEEAALIAMSQNQPPQPPQSANQPQDLTESGKGVPTQVSKALVSDALVPGGTV